MKAAVIVFPGSNCDRDVQVALEASTGQKVAMVWHADSELPEVDLIVLPGGFAYGDYLRCGAMAAQSPVMREVKARAERGVPALKQAKWKAIEPATLAPAPRSSALKY